MPYEAIVIGASSGGMQALRTLLAALPADFRLPVIVVQHIGPRSGSDWIEMLDSQCALRIREAEEKEPVAPGHTYIAPPNYHLLVEKDGTLSLASSERVNFARPSIDVLFESAAEAYKEKLIGIILTGSNSDGTEGMKKIKHYGGLALVQDPREAESSCMPASVISAGCADHVLPLQDIAKLLQTLSENAHTQII